MESDNEHAQSSTLENGILAGNVRSYLRGVRLRSPKQRRAKCTEERAERNTDCSRACCARIAEFAGQRRGITVEGQESC